MKKVRWFILFVLIGLGLYFTSLKNGFQYDDFHHIVKNPYIQTPNNLFLYFTEPHTFSTRSGFHRHYRPLLLSTYAINYYFGGLDTQGYHLVNLGFHIGSAFLLFIILQAMLSRRGNHLLFVPLAAGLIFLTTPFNSEVVNYITARSSVMCAFFYLLAFYFWVKYREVAEKPSTSLPLPATSYLLPATNYIVSLLAFLLAMLTKEMAITLPVILWLYDSYFVYQRPHLYWRNYLTYLPFLLTGILIGFILRIVFFGQFSSHKGVVSGLQFPKLIKIISRYFLNVLIPFHLSIWHKIDVALDITFWFSLIFVAGMIVSAYFTWRSMNHLWRTVSFFTLWFLIALLPTSIIPLTTPYQENRGYLAGVGVIAIVTVCMERLRKLSQSIKMHQTIIVSFMSLILIWYGIGVIERNYVWRTPLTLWSDVLKKYPRSTTAHIIIGGFYESQGQKEMAEREYRAALEINPRSPGALMSLGVLSFDKGKADEAETLFLKALELRPHEPIIHFYLGRIYEAKGYLQQALREYLAVLKVKPDDMRLPDILIEIFRKMGNLDKAQETIQFLKEKNPNNPAIRRTLGLFYQKEGNLDLAAREYEIVLSQIPEHLRTLLDLGDVYLGMNRLSLAEQSFQRALSLKPSYHLARINLAEIYKRQGRNDMARQEYRKILEAVSIKEKNSPFYLEVQKKLEGLR